MTDNPELDILEKKGCQFFHAVFPPLNLPDQF